MENEYIVGDYKIETQLGKSEAGGVYLARSQRSGETVAIRFFVPDAALSPAVLRRWEHSAANLAQLKHPALVAPKEAGVYRGVPYLVTDFLPGQTLRARLAGALPPAQAARLLLPVARALVYLHEHHLTHNNVHAGNIFSGKGFVLADSGVHQLLDLVSGEHGRSQEGAQADIRGLAGVLLEMVSGVQPESKGGWTTETVNAVLGSQRLPAGLSRLVRRAFSGGYADMQAFSRSLEALGQTDDAVASSQPAETTGPPRKTTASRRRRKSAAGWLVPAVLIIAVLAVVGVLLINSLLGPGGSLGEPTAVAALLESTRSATSSGEEEEEVINPTPAGNPAPEPTTTVEPQAQPPGIGSVLVSPLDGMEMVYVPAGEFPMGSNDREEDEKPQHNVYLDAFWIDRTEVTNGMFTLCVQAGACRPPVSNGSSQRPSYFDSPDFSSYPVIFVTWQQASDYCTWAGRRLPTEAEWEKAARGTEGYICPWGDNSPSSSQLNYNGEVGDTTQVGSYPSGASVYGALDMAGNVWEWVSDWYSSTAYGQAAYENPTGPDEGTRRVLRGGSWYYPLNDIRTANRFSASDNTVLNDVGFRCVLPAE